MGMLLPAVLGVLLLLIGLLVVLAAVTVAIRRAGMARREPSEMAVGSPWIPKWTGLGRGPEVQGGPSTFPSPPPLPVTTIGSSPGEVTVSQAGDRSPRAARSDVTPSDLTPTDHAHHTDRAEAFDDLGDQGPPESRPMAWGQARARAWRWSGILIGAILAYVAMTSVELGRGLLLAAPIFGVCAVIGALLGELTTLPAAGVVRRAELRVRRVPDYLPIWLSRVVSAAVVLLIMLAAVTTTVASRDDMGRPGRYLFCPSGAGAGPWPGSFYTVPALVAVLAGLALTGLSLRRIVRRPRPASSVEADDALRRRSAELVTAATGILVLVPLFGVALTAGVTLRGLAANCGHAWWAGAGGALEVPATLAFLANAWCLAVLLFGPVRVPVGRR